MKDAKARARHYNKEDKQYPNTKPWWNPYNNILDDLFKDLNNKSTKSLKAAIQIQYSDADLDYSTSLIQLCSSNSPKPGSTLKGNNLV